MRSIISKSALEKSFQNRAFPPGVPWFEGPEPSPAQRPAPADIPAAAVGVGRVRGVGTIAEIVAHPPPRLLNWFYLILVLGKF